MVHIQPRKNNTSQQTLFPRDEAISNTVALNPLSSLVSNHPETSDALERERTTSSFSRVSTVAVGGGAFDPHWRRCALCCKGIIREFLNIAILGELVRGLIFWFLSCQGRALGKPVYLRKSSTSTMVGTRAFQSVHRRMSEDLDDVEGSSKKPTLRV